MNKSIYEKALESLKKHREVTAMIKEIKAFEQALEQAQKQERLLNKIKGILDRPNNSINDIHVDKFNRYYEIEILVRELESGKERT